MRHRLLTAVASGATLVFSPVAAFGAAQGPDADSSTTLVLASSWVPTRGTAVAPLRRSIALDLKGVSIKQALREIGRRGGIEIAYGDDVLRARAQVSLQVGEITVQDAVVTVLAGTGLEAFVSLRGTTILVRAASEPAQGDTLTGRVTDNTGVALAGVRVSVVGTRFGAVTGPDGRYAIADVPPGTYRVQARLIGYAVAEVASLVLTAGQTATADFRLVPQGIELNPVVAVGYGEQGKATLTGSVSAVQREQIQGVPTVNVSNTLGGQLPGLVTVNQSGEPGYDGATIRIRGNHTLNDNSALIVIDGVADRVGGLERLDPQDIESISILKDASAAIYGARAANGVILVTTKRGRSGAAQPPQLTLTINQGVNHPTRMPQMADAATYMTMLNEINMYRNLPPAYTADQIQKTQAGADPWLYPNTDWFGAVIKPVSLQTRGNVALRGSGERIGYYLSLGGLTEDGYYRNSATRYNQYSFRSNIDGRVTDHLSLRFDVTGRLEDRNFPNRSAGDIFRALMRGKPNLPAYWPNGLPGPDIEFGNNPVVIATPATGYDKDQRDYVQGTLGVDFKVPGISGLTLRGNAAYDNLFRSEKQWRTPWTLYTWANQARDANGQPILLAASRGYSTPGLNRKDRRGTSSLLNLVAEYRRNVGPHTVGILGGVERQTADSEYVSALSPRSGQQYRLAVRVARLIGPGVERPGRPPLLLGPEEVVVGRIATQHQTADPRHLEVHAQRALDVVSLVLVVSRRRGRDHDRVVSELDVGSRQPVRPVRGQVGLAAHERAKDVARAPVREIAVLEATRHVEPQAQVVRDPAVDVAAEAVLVVPGGAVAVVAVLGQTAQREVIPDPLPAAPQGDVPSSLQRHGLDDRAEPVGVGIEPGIGARLGLLNLIRRVGGWQVAVHVDLVEHRHVRRGVRHLGNPRGVVDALIDGQRELRWLRGTATPALRGDEDDAVGRAGAVDRR